MTKNLAIGLAATLVLASVGPLTAHHSLALFDTTKPVRIKGAVVLFQRVNPHSMIFIDQKGANGEAQRWAVEGPAINALVRRGMYNDFLKVGDVIEACGYVTKDNTERTADAVSGRLMDGELIVLPNGRKEVWSDYGFHLCMDPDYRDVHR
jgi:hypothetical protein